MAVTLKQDEAAPESYPDLGSPSPLSAAAAALDAAFLWQRLEGYCACRWSERAVVWIVEGCGEWVPPLKPATVETVEIWSERASEWDAITLNPSPLGGYYLPATGPYRFTATVGADSPVPEAVLQAFIRLAEYCAQKPGKAGATSERIAAGSINLSHSRSASWMAKALDNSGAADLLRPYRRA